MEFGACGYFATLPVGSHNGEWKAWLIFRPNQPVGWLHEQVGNLKHHAKAVEILKEMGREGIEEWLSRNEYS